MSGKTASFCVALLLTLTSAFAAQRTLNSISELISCDPQPNILELLHWFASRVNIDNFGTIQLNFDPNSDYGSHHYGNFEGLLDRSPSGYRYYTVGNIHKDSSERLPAYVRRGGIEWNRARIIFSATESNGGRNIEQVYISQHNGSSGSSYDREHTYRVTTNLLRELRNRTLNEIQRLASGVQTGYFGNQRNSHLQGFSYSHQHHSRTFYDTQDTCNTCVWITCALVFSLIVIIIIGLGVHFAGRK